MAQNRVTSECSHEAYREGLDQPLAQRPHDALEHVGARVGVHAP
eukprot:CAMPEP_0113677902 /NCGR_PEP_ID=MMETSP0038_2-20120614/9581_1 /TAXON_ID=2898 /ORGANISM="Cryptomonas paramecium" /LENGTH=43 /DNA_ID=CAMNT_0000595343 /DNA_START=383 /DNA_END=510 /DNA_ORIENTATION=- /assembly_acc=CAM_ASM_000170